MRRKSLIVVGNGMATSRLLDELLARNATQRYDITVFGEEPGGAYNRVLLSKVLGGAEPDHVVMKTPEWYGEHGIRLRSGVRVTRLEPAARMAHLESGESLRYDVAVIATGSQPVVPPLEGMTQPDGELKPGVFVYRTMDDCLRMRGYARSGDNAVVLGGGLLGLEAAKVLSDRGLHVTVVHVRDSLMNAQLDFVGGEMLRRQIERCGIFVRTSRTIEAVLGEDAVEGVVLDDGQRLAADVVVLSCGVRARVDVARASDIPINKGILVNDTLATEVPGVYALGECVEHAGVTFGLVAPVWEQAAVLADVLSGTNPQARYRGSKIYSRLKVAGVEVASMGMVEPELESDEVLAVVEERRHAYRKLIVRGRRLLGALFVGDTRASAALVQLYDRGDLLPEDPLEALCSYAAGGSSSASPRMICNCNKVTEQSIVECIGRGAASAEAIADETRAGTGCGSCRNEIVQLVAIHARTPVAVPA